MVRPKNVLLRDFVIYALAKDFARPKRFREIRDIVNKYFYKAVSRQTLGYILKELIREGKVVNVAGKGKKYVYALKGWEMDQRYFEEIKAVLYRDLERIAKNLDRAIKFVKEHDLDEEEVRNLVFYLLTDFELRQLEGFEFILMEPWKLGTTFFEYYIALPYNMRINLLVACHIERPRAVREAIEELKKWKKLVLNSAECKNLARKLRFS